MDRKPGETDIKITQRRDTDQVFVAHSLPLNEEGTSHLVMTLSGHMFIVEFHSILHENINQMNLREYKNVFDSGFRPQGTFELGNQSPVTLQNIESVFLDQLTSTLHYNNIIIADYSNEKDKDKFTGAFEKAVNLGRKITEQRKARMVEAQDMFTQLVTKITSPNPPPNPEPPPTPQPPQSPTG